MGTRIEPGPWWGRAGRLASGLSFFVCVLIGAAPPVAAQICDGAWLPGSGVAGVDGSVFATLELPDGDVIVGGSFSFAGNLPVRNIARYNPVSGVWSPIGAGLDSRVRAIARLSNGDLVAGGDFSRSGQAEVARIARWNGVAWTNLGSGLDGPVISLVVQPDGDLIAGGDFERTMVGTQVTSVARWDGTSWSAVAGNFTALPAGVSALLLLPDGQLIAAGRFVANLQETFTRIARWDGSRWNAMAAGIGGTGNLSTNVYALARLPSGDIVAAGEFESAGAVSARDFAIWNGSSWASMGPGVEGYAYSLYAQSDGQLFAGGSFSDSATTLSSKLLRWDGATWVPLGSPVGGEAAPFFSVSSIRRLATTGELLVGGDSSGGDSYPLQGLARWSDATQTWSATASGGFNGDIRAFATLQNGDLVAAGAFTRFGNTALSRIARWNGSSWLAMGAGFNGTVQALEVLPNGTLVAGGVFSSAGGAPASNLASWNGSDWSQLGGGVNGEVTSLAVALGSSLAVGGSFTAVGGIPAQNISLWNGSSWAPTFANGVNGRVSDIDGLGDGFLVAGAFTTAGGAPAAGVASWPLFWLPLATSVDGPVTAVKSVPGVGIVAAGNFSSINGVSSQRVARLEGTNWQPMSLDLGSPSVSDRVHTLAVLPGGDLVAAGRFSTASNSSFGAIARWDGAGWSAFGRGLNADVYAVQSRANGDLAAGGRFRYSGTAIMEHFAEWKFAGGTDADGDGADDVCDNCPYAANPSQSDSGGIGWGGADGIGDACQCGDVTGDGRVQSSDVYAIRTGLASVAGGVVAPDRCSVTGPIDPGLTGTGMRRDCDVADFSVIERAIAQWPPGLAQVCESASP